MTLYVIAKSGKNTIKIYVDINGNRVTTLSPNTSNATSHSVDISSYISSLSTIELTPYNSNFSANTL